MRLWWEPKLKKIVGSNAEHECVNDESQKTKKKKREEKE